MSETITLAHSPDSDDAFMFYGLATNKLNTGDLNFQHLLKDIQTLNEEAMRGTYDDGDQLSRLRIYPRQIRTAAARRFDWRQLWPNRRFARAAHAGRHTELEDCDSREVDKRVSGAADFQF